MENSIQKETLLPLSIASEKEHFFAVPSERLKTILLESGEPAFRVAQVYDWIYQKRVWNPLEMSNLSSKMKTYLLEKLDWGLPHIKEVLNGQDKTTKLLFSSEKGVFESVIMRYENRTSLCVSSQVGCKLACKFCQTGKLGFIRHLSQEEILGQFAVANDIVKGEGRKITHVVFMGMGEPLDNFKPCLGAVNLLIGDLSISGQAVGFGLSRKNVTLSTSGIAPKIVELAHHSKCALAISLHAAREDLRSELMPINQRYGLEALKDALKEYQKITGQTITLEYILIKNKNSSISDAKALVKWIHGLRVKVNLIPFNNHPGLPYDRPDDTDIREFQRYLSERSIPAPVRYSKGLDVSAACGQLAAKAIGDLHDRPTRARAVGPQPAVSEVVPSGC